MFIELIDVVFYLVYDWVKNRLEELLVQDIIEVEVEVVFIMGYCFEDSVYDLLFDKVKLVLLKFVQYFVFVNSDELVLLSYQFEKMGDYLYMVFGEGGIQWLEVYYLFEEFIILGYVFEFFRLKVRFL